MREKKIRLSPKHGVNPMIPMCFYCGKEKNEVLMLGRLPKDAEAPRCAVVDYVPCDECKAKHDTGVLIIEVSETPRANQPSINPDNEAYPTGRWLVAPIESIKDDTFKIGSKALMLESDFSQLLEHNY
jgi:hypothetical protein